MDSLVSDQGHEFLNKVIDMLMDRFHTDHHIASANLSQSMAEGSGTLMTALSKLVNDQADDWDQYIPGILFAYQTLPSCPLTRSLPTRVMQLHFQTQPALMFSRHSIPFVKIVDTKNSRHIHRMGSKLEPRWTGPYVVESLSKGPVKLKNINTDKLLSNTNHAGQQPQNRHRSTTDVPHDLEHSPFTTAPVTP